MRTFPIHSEIPPQTNSPRWLILDGALLPNLELKIATLGVELSTNIEYRPLLRGTRWDKVSELGPYLVQWLENINSWAQEVAPYRYGIIFDADSSIDELRRHWEKLILCKHLGLENNLARLYDPNIFLRLLKETEEARFESWMGPMTTLWLPNLFNQQYWEAKSLAGTTVDLKEVTFNDKEWQSLSDASNEYTAWRLIQHIELYFPHKLQGSKQETHKFVLQQLIDLKQLGQINEQLATYYLNIVCRLGNVLGQNSHYPEITACLHNFKAPLEHRLKQANQLSISLARDPRDSVGNYP
ncbi:DUF4123 domain-containing protein [Vibrio sp. TBV020]|uniref:DUF4123 domain-containing protein n=1 Tax=Vibrio sp. TBV020 TaxID=3137398 RepID=UPI0038CD4FE5